MRKNGEPDRIRTCDQLIKSQLLYQLSYGPTQGRLPTVGPGTRQAKNQVARGGRGFQVVPAGGDIAARMSDDALQTGLPFLKMHGLGNDFVVIDARETAGPRVTAPLARALADRPPGRGGLRQAMAVIHDDAEAEADLRLVFFNARRARFRPPCGNATRCIARWGDGPAQGFRR